MVSSFHSEMTMPDFICIALGLAFFASMIFYAAAAERM